MFSKKNIADLMLRTITVKYVNIAPTFERFPGSVSSHWLELTSFDRHRGLSNIDCRSEVMVMKWPPRHNRMTKFISRQALDRARGYFRAVKHSQKM